MKLDIYRCFLCIAILLSLKADISSQAISNVHHYYGDVGLQNVHHFYDGTYTYSFYAVYSDTFFYEDQLALPLKNRENDIILLKLDEEGKVTKYTVFRSEVDENHLGTTTTSINKLSATIRGGEIFFNIAVDGYLYKDNVKVEANYNLNDLYSSYSNHFILGLDENLDIIFQKNINNQRSLPDVQQVAIRGDILYILGSFYRHESMHIEGDSVYRPNSILLTKSYLYAYDVAQDTLITKTCFSAGGSGNTIKPVVFDKDGNLYTALGHDQERLWLDGVYLPGAFGLANSVIIKFSPLGRVLDHYSTVIEKNNCFVSQLVLNTNEEIIVIGAAYANNKDSIAYIGQNGNTPINTQKNWASFIFKLDKNLETEWYNLYSASSGFKTFIQDVFIDDVDNLYFTLYNEKGFLITDLQGNEFEQGFHFCKLNKNGELIVHNKAGDLLGYFGFYSIKLKEANVMTINAYLRGDLKAKEALFGLTFSRKMNGAIFDFDIREPLSSTVENNFEDHVHSKIFPNPLRAGEQLIVGDDRYRDGRYEIYSIHGVPIATGTMSGNVVPTSAHLESGVYILRVSQGVHSFNRLITFF
ncbi:MAG: T9SS type A sorting domain-containing protein [Saprospiraceae bacterium]|jgi:hypothetical protein